MCSGDIAYRVGRSEIFVFWADKLELIAVQLVHQCAPLEARRGVLLGRDQDASHFRAEGTSIGGGVRRLRAGAPE